jgi:hypothetical protein
MGGGFRSLCWNRPPELQQQRGSRKNVNAWLTNFRDPCQTRRETGAYAATASLACPSFAGAMATTSEATRFPGTRSATTAPAASTADPHGRDQPIHVGLGRLEAARVREDRGQHGHAEHASDLAHRLVAPDAWPASSGRTELSTAFAAGANTLAMPLPANTKPGTNRP